MSKLTYGLGFALGTVIREFLRAVKKTSTASTATQSKTAPQGMLPPPCVPDHLVREMDHLPAMARKGIDLNRWYAANTRVVEKPSRKRRSRTNIVDQASPAIIGSLTPAAC